MLDEVKSDIQSSEIIVTNFESFNYLLMRANQHRIQQLERLYQELHKFYCDIYHTEHLGLQAKIKNLLSDKNNASKFVSRG